MISCTPLACTYFRAIHDFWWAQIKLALLFPTILLAITCVLSTQMGHGSPFWIFKFQKFFNGIKKFLIQWVLTSEIPFWRLWTPWGFQLPKWKSTWECVGSFPHIPKSANKAPKLHYRPTPFHAIALVVNLKLESWHPRWHLSHPWPWARDQGKGL